jgi:hypothetical protein
VTEIDRVKKVQGKLNVLRQMKKENGLIEEYLKETEVHGNFALGYSTLMLRVECNATSAHRPAVRG